MTDDGRLTPKEMAIRQAKERGYIRPRVFHDQAVDLVQLLFYEKNLLVAQKIKEREEHGVVSAETRRRLRVVSDLWREVAEQIDEVGWDRP